LLSPRILHFGRTQLFWECREHSACSAYSGELPLYYKVYPYSNSKSSDPNVFISKLEVEPKPDLAFAKHMMRDQVVKAYSQASLTVSSDKLVALPGIAKRFKSFLNDDYVAWMWRKYLENSLCW
jgi:hypothetical protein